MRRPAVPVLLALAAAASGLAALASREARFPHETHAGLFPTCNGCHAGIEAGEETRAFPAPSLCARCHDGKARAAVAWQGPERTASNLRFPHPFHLEAGADCQTCHDQSGGERKMAIGRAAPEVCLDCHTNEAGIHLAADAECAKCHLPLAEAKGLSAERIAAFPRPPSHEASDFPQKHGGAAAGAGAQCATCHARESCERCHLNGPALPPIAGLQRDERVAGLVAGRVPEYPVPADHGASDWLTRHGARATAASATCANCHARTSCATCHKGDGAPAVIASLPQPRAGGLAGAQIGGKEGAGHAGGVHAAGWVKSHGAAAAANRPTCNSCHAQSECADCHDGPGQNRFHPANFMDRHGPEAFARESDCASCHNNETFCRACHAGTGRSGASRAGAAFHDAQPNWLLAHGQAARQGLESCTSCHAQRDCLQCHSRTQGWGIRPHGRDFDAARMAQKNRLVCAHCHQGDPLLKP